MFKLYALAALFLVVGGAIYDMPSKCYSKRFAACSRAEFNALTSLNYSNANSVLGGPGVNWEDPRIN